MSKMPSEEAEADGSLIDAVGTEDAVADLSRDERSDRLVKRPSKPRTAPLWPCNEVVRIVNAFFPIESTRLKLNMRSSLRPWLCASTKW